MKRRIGFVFLSIGLIFFLLFGSAVAFLPLPGTVPVLMYHFIGTQEQAKESKNFVAARSFLMQMEFLKNLGYRVISMDELYEIRAGKRKGNGKEIVITFDDGNTTFPAGAFPILRARRFPAALFVVSESVKRQTNGSMSAETLKELLGSGEIVIGSHSRTHPLLSQLNEERIKEEVQGSKADLEALLGIPIHYFAYPGGDLDGRVIKITEEAGYRLAFTTAHKKLGAIPEGPYALARIKISRSSDNLLIFWFKVSGIYQFFKQQRHRLKVRFNPAALKT